MVTQHHLVSETIWINSNYHFSFRVNYLEHQNSVKRHLIQILNTQVKDQDILTHSSLTQVDDSEKYAMVNGIFRNNSHC